MRKFLIAAATAASALAVATPATAQYWPQPRGYAYGHHNNYGHVRSLQVRVDRLQHRIARLDSRDRISNREARGLRADARDLEHRLYRSSRNGLSPREFAYFEQRIRALEYRMQRDVRDGQRWGDNRWGDDRWDADRRWDGERRYDRDRDGRDDRYENDRGYDRD
jgi:hypothetical protein